MIIAEICFSKSWGGLEHYCADCIVRLTSLGHTVYPVVNTNSPLHNKLDEDGVEVIALKPNVEYLCPLVARKLTQLLKKHSIESIHLHRTQDLGTVLLAAKLASVSNSILTLQMESDREKRDPYHRWIYKNLTKVLTVSERMRKLVIKNIDLDLAKVECLYYGIDIERMRSVRQPKETIRDRWNIPQEAFVIGIVGRLEKYKGQEIVLKAAARLKEQIPELAVVIVGDETVGQGGELDRLKSMAQSLLSENQVVFTGYQAPPATIVPAFDVSLLATHKETFGLVILEAMALGVPVIATDAGGVPEILEDGVNGLLVQPDDPDVLAEAILKLYTEKSLRNEIASAGERTVAERFSLNTHIEGLERALGGRPVA